MNELIEEDSIHLNQQMTELLFKLDTAGYGWGFDLAEYLKTREDAIFFCELVRKTIIRYEEYYPVVPPTHRKMLHIFYDELHVFALNIPN
jgi:coproporphyrinogen III oxidase